LADQRGHSNVLLVLFDPTESRARVRALSNAQMELQQAGLRVIAIPARAEGAAAGSHEIDAPIVASFDRRITAAYAIVAPMNSDQDDQSAPKHAEFLIDRQGYIRARWTPHDGPAWLQGAIPVKPVARMDREKPQDPLAMSMHIRPHQFVWQRIRIRCRQAASDHQRPDRGCDKLSQPPRGRKNSEAGEAREPEFGSTSCVRCRQMASVLSAPRGGCDKLPHPACKKLNEAGEASESD
jgi:peroxiredoxin